MKQLIFTGILVALCCMGCTSGHTGQGTEQNGADTVRYTCTLTPEALTLNGKSKFEVHDSTFTRMTLEEVKEQDRSCGYEEQNREESNTIDLPSISPEEAFPEDSVWLVAEQMPEFPGGMEALMKYLQENISQEHILTGSGIQARVFVQFIVDKTGTLRDFKVTRSIDPKLDAVAIRICQSMPKWIPGKQGGEAVNVRFTLPIQFSLQ